jgi:uncharacterized membrane protein
MAIIPFPTALLAEFGFGEAATPAIVLYSSIILLTNIAWILISRAALLPKPLTHSPNATARMRQILRNSKMGFAIYLSCAVAAFWFPTTVFVVITLTWLLWLYYGLTIEV